MRFRWVLAAVLVTSVVLIALAVRDRDAHRNEYCEAQVAQTTIKVDLEQARWASLIAAQGQNRGLPPRATTIALATAFQESKLHNIDYGHLDSLGLFQQRPSQGWGTVEEVMDPFHSINRFYDGLVQVPGYLSLDITVAAQAVQRSAYPEAYAQHEAASRALASALRGFSHASFTCQLNPVGSGSPRAVVDDVTLAFGELGSQLGHDEVTTTFVGDDLDIAARGWALAHYAVANAQRLHITSVSFDGRQWRLSESDAGWHHVPTCRSDTVVVSTR